jgi:hypothetical protein
MHGGARVGIVQDPEVSILEVLFKHVDCGLLTRTGMRSGLVPFDGDIVVTGMSFGS